MNVNKDIFTKEDIKFMRLAIKLAQKGSGTVSPNPLVGAVIVKDGKIISTGYHKMAGTAHAEINAINAVKVIPPGSKMYVTLEPCSFYGKTPPCVDAIIKNKFSEVIISSLDPNPKVNGKGVEILRKAGISVKFGLLEDETKYQNEIFFKHIKSKMPFICVKIASSIDGKLAISSGDSKWITGLDSRKMVQKLRFNYGAILTGINTIIKDNPLLYPRKNINKNLDLYNEDDIKKSIITKKIIIKKFNEEINNQYIYSKFFRIILDSNLKIDLNSNIVKTSKFFKTIIFISKEILNNNDIISKINNLNKLNIDVIPVNSSSSFNLKNDQNNYLNLKEILDYLYNKYEITSILVEAGQTLVTSLLKENLIDKFLIFLAPKIIGESSYNMFNDLHINNMDECLKLKFNKIKKLQDDLLLEAYMAN
jgi:diaminohydroxyphosphoribosylaminopyrimidine deaminase/5-amino-6-(5-phosphoribosylamino)uracil reductase